VGCIDCGVDTSTLRVGVTFLTRDNGDHRRRGGARPEQLALQLVDAITGIAYLVAIVVFRLRGGARSVRDYARPFVGLGY